MAKARLAVTIRRPPNEVFAVLSDVTNVPRWSANTLEETLLTSGPLGVGSRRRAVLKGPFGRTLVNEAEMIEFVPDRRMMVRVLDAPVPARIVIELLPVPEGTRLEWTAEFSPRGVLRPVGRLAAWSYRRTFGRDLACLKTMMDRGEL